MCFSFKKQRRLPRKRQIYYCIYNGKHWSAEMEIDGIESQACFSNWGLRTLGGMWGWEGEEWTRGHPGVAKLNITDNAQSHSHIAAHKCWDSGPLLILPALHPFPLLGNDNSPSTYSLGKAGTKAPARAQAGPETLSVESRAKNSLLERFVKSSTLRRLSPGACYLDPWSCSGSDPFWGLVLQVYCQFWELHYLLPVTSFCA